MSPGGGAYGVGVIAVMKKILPFLPVLTFAAALLLWPETASAAAQAGLMLCFRTIIPALFPFFVVVSLLLQMGFAAALQRLFAPFMGPLFHLGGVCAVPLLAGLVGGYPSGARAAAELYDQGLLSRQEAEAALSFVNNCGPAFLLSYVGSGVLGSSRAGVYLLLIHVLSALVTGVVVCRLAGLRRGGGRRCLGTGERRSLAAAFPGAVTTSFAATLNICGFVVLFQVIAGLLPGHLPPVVLGFFEMVTGVAALPVGEAGFVAAAAIVGWGGLSIHCQTLSVTGELSLRWHWLGKALQAVLSAGLAVLVVNWL